MANTIKIKNTGTASATPNSLEYGELAINYTDGKIFYKNSTNEIVQYLTSSSSSVGGLVYSETIGNGSSTSIAINHNLETRDVYVVFRKSQSPYDVMDVAWEATTTNQITATFSPAPASNSVRVLVYAAFSTAQGTVYSANVGNGSDTEITLTHNLGTRDILVSSRLNESPYNDVQISWEALTQNTVKLYFGEPPNLNQIRVSVFANVVGSEVGQSILSLTDTNISSPSSGEFLKWDGTQWINAAIPSINSLDDISDVNISSATPNQFLKWDGTEWINANIPQINTLDDVGDVTVTSASAGDFLKYNGSAWVNDPVNLSTDTVGDYVQSLVAGTGVSITNNSGEAATPTISIGQAVGTTDNVTFNNLTVSGDLTVSGTTTTINTTELLIEDNLVVLNTGSAATPSFNAGIEVERGSFSNVSIIWNETSDKWQFTNDGTNYSDLGSGGASTSDSPPSSPTTGQIWFETDTGKTFVYYDSSWIEVGGGSNTQPGVCTSATRPSSPYEGQMIYETDTDKILIYNGSLWNPPWNTAWGFVADTTLATSLSYITTAQDVLSLTFTAVANRKYRYTATGLIVNNATGHISINFVNSSNTTLREYFTYFSASANNYQTAVFDYQESITSAGSITRKIRHPGSTPGVYYYGSDVRDAIAWKIRVEDIGPV